MVNLTKILTALLREARSTLWKCRLTKTIPKIIDLKNKIKKANTYPYVSTKGQRNNPRTQQAKNNG